MYVCETVAGFLSMTRRSSRKKSRETRQSFGSELMLGVAEVARWASRRPGDSAKVKRVI